MPLPPEHLLDELATAYVQTIVATAGATIAVSRLDYGVDGTLKHIVRLPQNRFVESGFPVDFQLKGTTTAAIEAAHVRYDLKARNFDLIATRPDAATPYYLFLVCFAADQSWVAQGPEMLTLRASAYWWSYSGPATRNTASVRIEIPIGNRLTSEAVQDMLLKTKARFAP